MTCSAAAAVRGVGKAAILVEEVIRLTTLDDFAALARGDHGLVVVSTVRADGTVQASLVNAGVLDHPLTGRQRATVEGRAQ